MKKTLIALFCAASVHSFAQITINSNHLPNSGDLLFTREATLLTDVDLDATGPNFNWNFGDDVIQPGALDAGTECVDMGSLSLVDQLFFNNPLFPDYNSDFGIGASMLSGDLPIPIAIENAYQIYKNSGNVYAMTGIVATIEGIPLNAQYDERDIIYNLPLTYNSTGSSHSVLQLDVPTIAYYGTDQYRDYQCDGWGTINLYGQSFDVLRVKSTVIGFDSLFASFLPFGGIQFPKDITTYQWLSTEFKVPVLEITSTESPFLGTEITARTADFGVGIEETVSNSLSVFPNPTSGEIVLSEGNSSDYYTILNSSGQKVKEGSLLHKRIDTQSLASGLYFIRLEQDGITRQTRFVRQ